MQMQEKKIKGFSLLELIVVVSIIGILSAISFQPFMSWRGDRAARIEAQNITSVIKDIFSQVQRGQYSFVQFEIQKINNEYLISSNGMFIDRFTGYVRDKYNASDQLNDFHKFTTRCSDTLTWDHVGEVDENILTVNQISVDATKIGIGVEGSDVSSDGGRVCFSKDGTYYSPGGIFLSGSTPIERLFICTVRSSVTGCSVIVNNEPPSDQKNTFALEWSRFGNISLKKYSESNGWIEQ